MVRLVCIGTLWGVLTMLCHPVAGWGDIYKYVDAGGTVHFTDTPTTGKFHLFIKEATQQGTISAAIRRYASLFRLDEALVKAVIKAESDYNPHAVSSRGALGIMQLLPETARDMAVADPMDPVENIRGGSRYLRLMLDRFDGNLDLALAAYNAGPSTVKNYDGIPPFDETRDYVHRVERFLEHYRQEEGQ